MRLYARREPSGEVRDIFLIRAGQSLALFQPSDGEGELPLPDDALPAIFRRYGKPLEPGIDLAELALTGEDEGPLQVPLSPSDGDEATLRRFRFMPFGWVYPADYLLWESPPQEPLAAPAPLIVGALTALGQALRRQKAATP